MKENQQLSTPVAPGSRWRNKKTGHIYTVILLANDDSEEIESAKILRVIYSKPI